MKKIFKISTVSLLVVLSALILTAADKPSRRPSGAVPSEVTKQQNYQKAQQMLQVKSLRANSSSSATGDEETATDDGPASLRSSQKTTDLPVGNQIYACGGNAVGYCPFMTCSNYNSATITQPGGTGTDYICSCCLGKLDPNTGCHTELPVGTGNIPLLDSLLTIFVCLTAYTVSLVVARRRQRKAVA